MFKAVLSKKDLSEEEDYYGCVKDLLSDKNILRLREYTHHCGTTRFQHSLNVSYYNFRLCRFLHLDARAGARAGLFHDLFFYDRHEHERVKGEGWHGIGHPKVAFFNTCELFSISQKEGDMIANHMWPLSPRLPKYRETFVITLVDKFCACAEVLSHAAAVGFTKLKLAQACALVLAMKLTLH
jgi:uncharacterized protein